MLVGNQADLLFNGYQWSLGSPAEQKRFHLLGWVEQRIGSIDLMSSKVPKVLGATFLVVLCGDAVFTLGVIEFKVPCIKPWDRQYGQRLSGITAGEVVLHLAEARRIRASHLGLSCVSLNGARDPQLRDAMHPDRPPGLRQDQDELVAEGNSPMGFATCYILSLYNAESQLSMENPDMSWTWLLTTMLEIYGLP